MDTHRKLLDELLMFFYKNQYKYDYYPTMDMIVEHDNDGTPYNTFYIVEYNFINLN
mgnify:CR=1 FL=1